MRIGIDARLWDESGVGRYIRNVVRGLDVQLKNHELVIFLQKKSIDSMQFKNPNIRLVQADVRWHSVSEQLLFKNIIEKENIDLMHFPYFSYPILYKKPFVVTIHDLIIDHFPTGKTSSLPLPLYYLKRIGYSKIVRSAVMNAGKIIVPSEDTKKEIIKHYNAKSSQIKVIYEGFDPLIQRNHQKLELVSKNYILYVGNAYPHKNLGNLIKAFQKIREVHDIELVMIGRRDFFYDRLSANSFNGVHFLHNVDDSLLFEYYKNAICTVVPSFMEGFGLPLLEALSLSCPVASSNTSSLTEVGGDACLYFNPKNVDEIAEKVNRLVSDSALRERLIIRGLKQSRKFSWEDCVRQTIDIYESSNSIRPS